MEKMWKLFTHTDLDGVGCRIFLENYTREKGIKLDVEYCEYDNINEKVEEFILSDDKDKYDKMFVTDLSVNEDIASIINDTYADKAILLDHHKTALSLNKYDWVTVRVEDEADGELTSGTYMVYKWLKNFDEEFAFTKQEEDFAEKVRRYDSWLWSTKYDDQSAKQLNDLYYIYGRGKFCNNMLDRLSYGEDIIDSADLEILEIEERRKQEYIRKRNDKLNKCKVSINQRIWHIGIVFADQYISELGNQICKSNDIDFCAIINMHSRTVSLRSIGDVDVSAVAQLFEGGGHKKASGFKFDKIGDNQILLAGISL